MPIKTKCLVCDTNTQCRYTKMETPTQKVHGYVCPGCQEILARKGFTDSRLIPEGPSAHTLWS